jgi:glyoxylase-like metal-dependent hydrolase (beta-lactamase superfamily II)
MSDLSTVDVPQITTDELRERLDNGAPTLVLDIRPAEDFEEWHVPGSRNVPAYASLKQGEPGLLANTPLPDDRPIVTVCGAGKTSRTAAEWLRRHGKNAYSLTGGLESWTFAWNTAEVELPNVPAHVVQVRRTGKGCLSYVLASKGAAFVIDPALEPAVYERIAGERGWQIVGIADTHIHADHFSRGQRLAERIDAPLYLPRQNRVSYEFTPVAPGEELTIGAARIVAHHTPGHTPEHVTFEVDSRALFTGDTLFTSGVGRPDLDAGDGGGREKAHRLYHSLQPLMTLPEDILVLPGHTSRPVDFDEAVIGAPLREVKERVESLRWSESRFVDEILDRVPPTPPNHDTIIIINETGEWPAPDQIVDLEAGANRCAVE